MAYIIRYTHRILAQAGNDSRCGFWSNLVLLPPIGCLIMRLIANYPIALAPGWD